MLQIRSIVDVADNSGAKRAALTWLMTFLNR